MYLDGRYSNAMQGCANLFLNRRRQLFEFGCENLVAEYLVDVQGRTITQMMIEFYHADGSFFCGSTEKDTRESVFTLHMWFDLQSKTGFPL